MLLSVRRCPMPWFACGLLALGCGGETLTLGGSDTAASAAGSGSAPQAPVPEPAASGAGAPALAGAGSGQEGRSGAVAGGAAGGVAAVAGASGSPAGTAGAGGSTGRRRRGGAAGAADGGAGTRSPGQPLSQAGTGGRAGRDAGAAVGCVQNLACQLPAPESTGDVHQDCVDRINQFRQECACLAPLARWVEGEACADEMAKYDSGSGEAHAAVGDNICEGGSAQNECPGWRSEAQVVSVCLQKMWDEGPPPMSDCTGSCFQTYGHFLNMTNQRMTKVACGFHERDDGQIWSVQNFAR